MRIKCVRFRFLFHRFCLQTSGLFAISSPPRSETGISQSTPPRNDISLLASQLPQSSPLSPSRRSRSPIRRTSPPNVRPHSAAEPSRRATVNYSDVRYEFMAGKIAKSKILHAIDEEQLYRYRVTHKSLSQYNCYINDCKAKLYVDTMTNICFRKPKQSEVHNHGPHDGIEAMQLASTIKKRCRSAAAAARSGGNGNVRQIFHNAIREWVFKLIFFLCILIDWL